MFKSSVLLVLAVSLLPSCGGKRDPYVSYGQTKASELKAKKGEPKSEEEVPQDKDTTMLVYEDDQKYQVKDDTVVAGFRLPEGDESELLYWRHRFRDLKTSYLPMKAHKDSPLKPEMELKCDAEGVSVIYDPQANKVVRIVEYAKKL